MLAGQILTFQDSMGFVDCDVNSCDINGESSSPFVIVETAQFVRRKKHAGGNDNCVEAAVGEHGVVKHPRDAVAVRDVTRRPDRSSASADAAAGHANSFSMPGDNLPSRFVRGLLVAIGAHHMGALASYSSIASAPRMILMAPP
jgi:hypothetical protein